MWPLKLRKLSRGSWRIEGRPPPPTNADPWETAPLIVALIKPEETSLTTQAEGKTTIRGGSDRTARGAVMEDGPEVKPKKQRKGPMYRLHNRKTRERACWEATIAGVITPSDFRFVEEKGDTVSEAEKKKEMQGEHDLHTTRGRCCRYSTDSKERCVLEGIITKRNGRCLTEAGANFVSGG